MFDRPILIYSDYCIHSTTFLNTLAKNPELFNAFIRINIDADPNTRTRPSVFYELQRVLNYKIEEIPTIITPGPEQLLTGDRAFEWLEFQNEQCKPKEDLQGFNSIEMGSFSDSYSLYGSTDLNNARDQCFQFVNKPGQRIETPEETSPISKDGLSNKQKERESFDNIHLMAQQPNQFVNKMQSKMSDKQKDIENKYQQMMMERQQFGQR
jgi:hypothetical protein